MTAPRRRPIQLDADWVHDFTLFQKSIANGRNTTLAGISTLKAALHDAGWPERMPTDDRKDRSHGAPTETVKLPTVWQCCECANQFADWDEFEDHAEHSGHDEATEETTGHSTTGATHSDPTSDARASLASKHGDLDSIQEHWHTIATSWRAIKLITKRHTPDGDKRTEPACWKAQCDQTVESRVLADGSVSYRGMTCIDGVWFSLPDVEPVCRKHRAQDDRSLKAV